jgi:hypothetical protein
MVLAVVSTILISPYQNRGWRVPDPSGREPFRQKESLAHTKKEEDGTKEEEFWP